MLAGPVSLTLSLAQDWLIWFFKAPYEGFDPSPDSDSQSLRADVAYTVNSRTRAGSHAFWMDIYGELIDADGCKIQDIGVYRLPFEVDTHLRTKVLMLTIIAVAPAL